MKRVSLKLFLAGFVLLTLSQEPCGARMLPPWPYDQLTAESDLVAIVEPIDNEPAKDTFDGSVYGHSTTDFTGVNTRFTVNVILKYNGALQKELIVLHFLYAERVAAFDGASFVRFLVGPLAYEKRELKDVKPVGAPAEFYQEKPTWLAFLKQCKDGRFEPVTGQYDAALSFRELHQASFFVRP